MANYQFRYRLTGGSVTQYRYVSADTVEAAFTQFSKFRVNQPVDPSTIRCEQAPNYSPPAETGVYVLVLEAEFREATKEVDNG